LLFVIKMKNYLLSVLRKCILKLKAPIRSILGIEDLKLQIERTNSYLEFVKLDVEKLEASQKYVNFNKITSLLYPMDVQNAVYKRIGRDHDGGYVMLDGFNSTNTDAAYSLGINDDVSWDEQVAERGIDIYMYDHTIEGLPRNHKHFHFFKIGVTGDTKEEGLKTLSNLIKGNGHEHNNNLLLKMDIEGYEWSVFNETPSSVINQFSQIVLEFHGLSPDKNKHDIDQIVSVLNKINITHQSIHLHANVFGEVSWVGGKALPEAIEVTYIRRDDYKNQLVPNERVFPTKIDQSCSRFISDVELDAF